MTADRVPLAFRAQIPERCQLQFIKDEKTLISEKNLTKKDKSEAEKTRILRHNDAYIWAQQWLKSTAKYPPKFGKIVETKDYQITWRFVTNSGQDEGIIRPVIGGKGHAFYPGSSMKGAFRRAFRKRFPNERDRLQHYCGSPAGDSETKPGILRFHGAYPIDDSWQKDSIVDVVHPQEPWQVESNQSGGAFFMISLLRPTLRFGISSNEKLSEEKWDEIWSVWETALGYGIGSRVSAGYGQIAKHEANKILSVYLKGEGLISKRVDGSKEFRPNMFKAALRGHTLRLFGGVTNKENAEHLTKKLWGGFPEKSDSRKEAWVGELGIAFNYNLDDFEIFPGQVPPFELERSQLDLLALNVESEARQKELKRFLIRLIKFSMMLGGFGKSWRRSSHNLFFSNPNYKPDIGCHWEFIGAAQALYVPFNSVDDIKTYFSELYQYIQHWVNHVERKQLKQEGEDWREAWHPNRVQVWARFDDDNEAISDVLDWLHHDGNQPYSLKRTHLGGRMGQIGRVWQRMYPRFICNQEGQKRRRGFVEFLTIFPDLQAQGQNKQRQVAFLNYLENQSNFGRVW
jgi:CRISPR-associated protein Cmr6